MIVAVLSGACALAMYWLGRRHGYADASKRVIDTGKGRVRVQSDDGYVLIVGEDGELRIRSGDSDAAAATVGRVRS